MNTPILIALIAAGSAIGSAVISGVIGTLLGSFLQRRSAEHEIRFSKLHERQADVVEHLHKLVVGSQRAFERLTAMYSVTLKTKRLTTIIDRQEEVANNTDALALSEWSKTIDEVKLYYEEHKLWLARSSIEQLDSFFKVIDTLAARAFHPSTQTGWIEMEPSQLNAQFKTLLDEYSKARSSLEHDFRMILSGSKARDG